MPRFARLRESDRDVTGLAVEIRNSEKNGSGSPNRAPEVKCAISFTQEQAAGGNVSHGNIERAIVIEIGHRQ